LQILQHYNALLHWWQKKLPLRNQPSNPVAQLLGRGILEASRYLAHAQLLLLDPMRRRQVDEQMAAAAQEEALGEFAKYVEFSLQAGVLTPAAEANLTEFGRNSGLRDEQISARIEEAMRQKKVRRLASSVAAPAGEIPAMSVDPEAARKFIWILRLSEVNMGRATESVRGIFVSIAHNLGIDFESGKNLIEDYLEEEELALCDRLIRNTGAAARSFEPAPAEAAEPKCPPARFDHPLGAPMLLIPAGEFMMGSEEIDAAPNESPITPVTLSDFYMALHPVTNSQYEQFDSSHRRKRMAGAGDDHPVVYVTSLEAVQFCQWLEKQDGRKYRLPTEAEWEYAARGTDGRKYPWGSADGRGDLANFADASTSFSWRHPVLRDGYAETSPVGAFPAGASFFGVEEMAGNVWEWCLEFLQPLSGRPKRNPRGAIVGSQRVCRGGSWKSRFSSLRTTARSSNSPNQSSNDLGFRIVCEVAPNSPAKPPAPGCDPTSWEGDIAPEESAVTMAIAGGVPVAGGDAAGRSDEDGDDFS